MAPRQSAQLAAAAAAGVGLGIIATLSFQRGARREPDEDDEDDHGAARARVWRSIGGAVTAAQLYVGDKLGLYASLYATVAFVRASEGGQGGEGGEGGEAASAMAVYAHDHDHHHA